MKALFTSLLLILVGCYGVNEKTSEIASLNTECLSTGAWNSILNLYSVKDITDKKLLNALTEIRKEPFTTDVLYFKANPEELIAVATDHYSIRYVFNSNNSEEILNGFQLSNSEKMRVRKRIQLLLIDYQCKEGKIKSERMLNEEIK